MKGNFGLVVSYALLAAGISLGVFGIAERADAWDRKFSFTATGESDTSVVFAPTYAGVHYTYAKAPTIGNAWSQFERNNQTFAVAIAYNAGTECANANLSIETYDFEASADISSGTATCIAYDKNSTYFQQALCPQDPSQ